EPVSGRFLAPFALERSTSDAKKRRPESSETARPRQEKHSHTARRGHVKRAPRGRKWPRSNGSPPRRCPTTSTGRLDLLLLKTTALAHHTPHGPRSRILHARRRFA